MCARTVGKRLSCENSTDRGEGEGGGGRRVHNRRHRLFFFFFPQHSTPTYSLLSFLYIFVPLVQGGGIVFPYRVGNCNEMCSLTSLCRCSSQPKSYVTSDHCFFFFSLLHISLFLRHKSQRDSLISFFFFESNTRECLFFLFVYFMCLVQEFCLLFHFMFADFY